MRKYVRRTNFGQDKTLINPTVWYKRGNLNSLIQKEGVNQIFTSQPKLYIMFNKYFAVRNWMSHLNIISILQIKHEKWWEAYSQNKYFSFKKNCFTYAKHESYSRAFSQPQGKNTD
jgi:Zn-finger nucleic acid-binding protein